MKKRRTIIEKEHLIYERNNIVISKVQGVVFFEIKNHTTFDLMEAVVLMMKNKIEGEVWNLAVNQFSTQIDTEKALYWLSGGDKEWVTLDNYNDSWHNLYQEFCDRWCDTLKNILDNSNSLGHIKKSIESTLSLMNIYNWALSKGLVK